MALTLNERKYLTNKIYNMVMESLWGDQAFYEGKKKSDDEDDDYDESETTVVELKGLRIIPDNGEKLRKSTEEILNSLIPVLQDANDDSVNSFNLTRSQISYELWPGLDKDAARSKLSQKINGKKAWREWELNRISNIISGDIA